MQTFACSNIDLLNELVLGQVGTDANAQLLRDSLQKCGVDLSYLREIEGPSGTAMIMVDPSGGDFTFPPPCPLCS